MVRYWAAVCAVAMTLGVQAAHAQVAPATQPAATSQNWLDAPKISPFTAIRWKEEVPEVQMDGTWYGLVSLNGISAAELVGLCKSVDAKDWQKRFEEDMVAVLIRTGHTPGDTAIVTVRELDSGRIKTLEKVAMTEENRHAIMEARRAAEEKARGGPAQ